MKLKRRMVVVAMTIALMLTACAGGNSESPANATQTTPTNGETPAKGGPPGNGNSGDTANPLPVTANDTHFTSTHFSGSGNCALCHNGLTDTTGHEVSIETDWSTSMMANSTRDPFWRAKVSSEILRNPLFKAVLDDKCSRCHAPMANVEAKYEGSNVELFGEGFLNPLNAYYNHALEGVSCTLCHQIDDNGTLGTEDGFQATTV